jgi:hypothetical protein
VRHEVRPGVKLTMHHSRDTASKQWSETKVLALQGLARLLRCALASPFNKEFSVLPKKLPFATTNGSPRITLAEKKAQAAAANSSSGCGSSLKTNSSSSMKESSGENSGNWFSEAWYRMLVLGLNSVKSGDQGGEASSSSAEVAVAGVFLLILMVKISSSSGVSNDPVRYATGMRVVNGALVQMDKNKLKSEAAALLQAKEAKENKESGSTANNNTTTITTTTSKKWYSKQAWLSSWLHLLKACESFEVDEDGDIGSSITEGFAQIFKSCEDAELSASDQIIELLNGLACLIPPRYPPLILGQRAPFRLPITKSQKNVLALIKVIATKLTTRSSRFDGDEVCV